MKNSPWSKTKLLIALGLGLLVLILFFHWDEFEYISKTTCSLLNRQEASDIGRFIYRYEPRGIPCAVFCSFLAFLIPIFELRPALEGSIYALENWRGGISAWLGFFLALSVLLWVTLKLQKIVLPAWESRLPLIAEWGLLFVLALLAIYLPHYLLFALILGTILLKASYIQRVSSVAVGLFVGILITYFAGSIR